MDEQTFVMLIYANENLICIEWPLKAENQNYLQEDRYLQGAAGKLYNLQNINEQVKKTFSHNLENLTFEL